MRKRIEKVDLTPERREQTRQRKDDVSRALGREVPVRKTYGDSGERKEFGGERKPFGEKREFISERKPFNSDERKPYGEKREFGGEKKPYGERPERREFTSERKPFNSDERKPYGEKREFGGERKPYGERPERREFTSERKPFNSDERKPYGEKREFGGERKPYGEKREFNSGERKPHGEKREFGGERKPYGEKREFNSERPERREFTGERKPFNSDERKPYGEKKEFNSERPERRKFNSSEREPYGEKREFNSERPERREFTGERKTYGEKREFNSGERKPYGEKREFTGERKPFNPDERKPYGEKREFNSGERKSYGEKREFNSERPERREFTGERKPYEGKREFTGERKPYEGKREFNSSERKPYEGKREFTGERKPFNPNERKPYGEKREFNSGERKPHGEKREFNAGERKPYGERPVASGERKSYGDKPLFSYGNDKRKPVAKRFDKGDFNKPRPNFGDKPSFEEKKSQGEGNDKPEKTYGSAKVNFGGKNLFKAHNPAEQSEKWTPTYKIGQYRDTAPKKVQKKIEASEKKNSSEIRLNRFIANAGICSRREADDIIKAGEISVNGEVITEMGHQVQPGDVVKMGNKKLSREKMVYVLINKPKDFITTTEDPDDRKTVMDLVKNACEERIYPVGRLDRNTTGLLLLTNDGELADKLTHPSNEVEKLYQVELDKPLTPEHQEQILKGITLEDGEFKADEVGIVTPDNMVIGIKIHSGRNRIVRRLFESLGYDVLKLDRTTFAGLNKKDLPRGSWRFLTEKEVVKLKFFK